MFFVQILYNNCNVGHNSKRSILIWLQWVMSSTRMSKWHVASDGKGIQILGWALLIHQSGCNLRVISRQLLEQCLSSKLCKLSKDLIQRTAWCYRYRWTEFDISNRASIEWRWNSMADFEVNFVWTNDKGQGRIFFLDLSNPMQTALWVSMWAKVYNLLRWKPLYWFGRKSASLVLLFCCADPTWNYPWSRTFYLKLNAKTI